MNRELPQRPVEKSKVLETLIEKGWDDPEARAIFYRWVDQRMEELDEIPSRENRDMQALNLMLEQARVLFDAGAMAKSEEVLEHASLQALDGMGMSREEFNQVIEEFNPKP